MPTSSEAVLASSETRKAKISIHHIKTLRFNKHLPFVFIHLPATCHNSWRGRTHSDPRWDLGVLGCGTSNQVPELSRDAGLVHKREPALLRPPYRELGSQRPATCLGPDPGLQLPRLRVTSSHQQGSWSPSMLRRPGQALRPHSMVTGTSSTSRGTALCNSRLISGDSCGWGCSRSSSNRASFCSVARSAL